MQRLLVTLLVLVCACGEDLQATPPEWTLHLDDSLDATEDLSDLVEDIQDFGLDMSPDISVDMRPLYGSPTSLSIDATQGVYCEGRQCDDRCSFEVTTRCRPSDAKTRRFASCDDGLDCGAGQRCCLNTEGPYGQSACMPEAMCPTTYQNAAVRICDDDSVCGGGHCCDGRFWSTNGKTRFHVCQPTPCETCYWEDNAYCVDVDFGAVDLRDHHMQGGRLFGVSIHQANLSNVVLSDVLISGGNWQAVVMDGAQLQRVQFGGFIEAASHNSPTMHGVSLRDGMLRGVSTARWQIERASFVRTHFIEMQVRGAFAQSTQFTDTVFRGGAWFELNTPDGQFERARFENIRLTGWTATNANLRGAVFRDVEVFRGDFTGADFSRADLTGARFVISQFEGAIWTDAICPDGTLANDHGATCVNSM